MGKPHHPSAAKPDPEGRAVKARPRRVATRPDPSTTLRPAPPRPALARGELRALVLAHLRKFPELEFTPGELAKALRRPTSRGAIMKICNKLVGDGLAIRTQQRPQRYRANPAA